MKTIRVSPDRWNFEEEGTGKRFVPFGSNFCFHYYADEARDKASWSICILAETPFRKDVIERAFAAAHEMNLNVMKIFLPITTVLPDPQQGTRAKIADLEPSWFERLEFVFGLAEKYNVYLSMTLAEWGIGALKWFNEGGQLFGLKEGAEGTDSFAILADFWKQIAAWAKGRPQLFSYNLAVESYLPGDVAKGKEGNRWFMFDEKFGADAFRSFLRNKYGNIEAVNAAHETAYASFEEVMPPEDIVWTPYYGKYNYPTAVVCDYVEMKEVVSYFYYKNMADAIRSVDDGHMITLGLHPDQVGLAPKGWAYKVANINNKLLDFVDYVTVHLYTQMSYLIDRPELPAGPNGTLKPGQSYPEEIERRRHECELYARFVYSDRPVMLEEFGHHRLDEKEDPGYETYKETYNLFKSLLGHVSGVMLWNYGFFSDNEGNCMSAFMDADQKVNRWGKLWKKLGEQGGEAAELPAKRIPAKTVVTLDYGQAYVPTEKTPGEKILDDWDFVQQPVDFVLEENRALVIYKKNGKKKIW